MKPLSNLTNSKFVVSAIAAVSHASGAFAKGSDSSVDLSLFGKITKNYPQGDCKYPNASHFSSNGSHNFIYQFARKMAQSDSDIPVYEDVLTRLVAVWEMEQQDKSYDHDLAPAFAYYTMVNVALAKNQPYELNFYDNMVAQNRKPFCSLKVVRMSNATKLKMYDYMITESAYMQAMASAGRERDFNQNESLLASIGNSQIENTYSYSPSKMVIADIGVSFE